MLNLNMDKTRRAPLENGTVILKRTFNQPDFQGGLIKFWRVVGPSNHPSLNSDISLEKLKEWRLL